MQNGTKVAIAVGAVGIGAGAYLWHRSQHVVIDTKGGHGGAGNEVAKTACIAAAVASGIPAALAGPGCDVSTNIALKGALKGGKLALAGGKAAGKGVVKGAKAAASGVKKVGHWLGIGDALGGPGGRAAMSLNRSARTYAAPTAGIGPASSPCCASCYDDTGAGAAYYARLVRS